jgi:starvation-inducible DNA-binding protein
MPMSARALVKEKGGPVYPTRNDLPATIRESMIELLDARLADAVDLQTQMKQAHWNVKGPNFAALHELFDKINADVAEYVDTIAERAVQLGGVAHGTARQVATRSTLPELPLARDGRQHVEAVTNALATFGKSVRAGITASADAGDLDTADLFTEVSRGVDKWLWFTEAHLQAER